MTVVEFEGWVLWLHGDLTEGDDYSMAKWIKLSIRDKRELYKAANWNYTIAKQGVDDDIQTV